MKKILAHTLGALALMLLVVAPAAADAPQTPATADAPLAFLDQAVQVNNGNGPPADLPNRGYACVLPPQQQNETCICPAVFDPVCGCNGETYSNSCFAACEVRSWSDGACDGEPI